jgi:hypothetical protein
VIDDPRPIKLRAADQADEIPQMVYALSQHVRDVRDDALRARDLHNRAMGDQDIHTHQRVRAELIELQTSTARTCEYLEALTRRLRAAGRL